MLAFSETQIETLVGDRREKFVSRLRANLLDGSKAPEKHEPMIDGLIDRTLRRLRALTMRSEYGFASLAGIAFAYGEEVLDDDVIAGMLTRTDLSEGVRVRTVLRMFRDA